MDLEKHADLGGNQGIMTNVLRTNVPELADLQTSSFDPVSLWERVDGDLDLLFDLMEIFREEFPALLKRIETAIQQGDPTGLGKVGHKIKGSLLQFSGQAAAAIAQELEHLGKNGTVMSADGLLLKLRQEVECLMRSLDSMVRAVSSRQGSAGKSDEGAR